MLPLVALMVCCIFSRAAPAAESEEFHVNIGFSSKAFVNVPREDIRVAVRILSRRVARKTVGSADSQIYDSTSDIERDLKMKKLDAVALTPEDFLELSSDIALDPVMVTATDSGREVSLFLLTRKDSRIRTVQDLKSRTITIPAKIVQYGNMYFTWVETLIMREGFQKMEAFFSTVNEASSPSRALMQVFFHQGRRLCRNRPGTCSGIRTQPADRQGTEEYWHAWTSWPAVSSCSAAICRKTASRNFDRPC